MKISYNWLQEFVDLSNITPEELGEKLTLHTSEVEEIEPQSEYYEAIYTGKLLEVSPHPDAEKLSVAQFDLGKLGKKQIIFGQVHQVEIGEILPIVLAGAKLKSGIEIKDGDIRGEKSEGMICDNPEMGMKNEALMRFPASTPLGVPLSELLASCADTLIDIDNKSLTHRPDLMGHRGFAREIAAIFGRNLLLPEPLVAMPKGPSNPVNVDIQTPNCRRFCAIRVENITVEPSSDEDVVRLEHLGVRAISNLVDITNLIMLGHGQPMHVFDADKIEGDIVVRQAKKGETLVALDGEEYKLSEHDTVVADSKKVLSIAGIMGGAFSGVTAETKNIIFESANWDPVAIRKTSTRLGLRSDSSMRYEKSLDPEMNKRAVLAATEQLLELCPEAKITSTLCDVYPTTPESISIAFRPQLVRDRSGLDVSDTKIKKRLESIGFEVKEGAKAWKVDVPSFRATKDVSIPEDLVEEVVRLEGFNTVPDDLPQLIATPPEVNQKRELDWRIRDNLCSQGYLESYGYSFVDDREQNFTGTTDYVEVANPLTSEHQFLRQTLIFNTIQNIESELRTHGEVFLFELGKTYFPSKEVLPREDSKLLIMQASMSQDETALFYELKNTFHQLCKFLRADSEIQYALPEASIAYLHPSKSASISVNGVEVGDIGVLHPSYLPAKNSHVAFLEIETNQLFDGLYLGAEEYKKLLHYPAVHRDLSVIVSEKTLMTDIIACSQEASKLLYDITLFDEYADTKKLGEGIKNLAFHLQFRSGEKTLDEEEIEQAYNAIVESLGSRLGAQLRSEFDKK